MKENSKGGAQDTDVTISNKRSLKVREILERRKDERES